MQTYKVIVDGNKTTCWYNDKDQPHRLDGPALKYADGSKAWFVEGKLHRLEGPAVESVDGYKEWWIKGKQMSKKQFNTYIKPAKTFKACR